MELAAYFKSIIEQETASVVVCDLEHRILYMNPAAIANYAKRGGSELIGKNLLDCHNSESVEWIRRVVAWFAEDVTHNRVHTFYNEKQDKDVYMIALRGEDGELIGYYEKHEFRRRDETPFYEFYRKDKNDYYGTEW